MGSVGNAGGGIGAAPVKKVESGKDGLNLNFGSGHCDCEIREGNVLGQWMEEGRLIFLQICLSWSGRLKED